MATVADLCNLALDNLGVTNKITALSDATKEGRACNRWYAHVRDLVLRAFPWSFAARSVELVESTETHPEWALVYVAPTDMLKARRVYVAGQARNTVSPIPFYTTVNTTGTGLLILTDTGTHLAYTRKLPDDAHIALFTPAFVDALSWKLAARLVIPLALEKTLIKGAEEMYTAALAGAVVDAVDEMWFDPQPDADYLGGRGV